MRFLIENFQRGEMSATQKEGINNCSPKGDKPRDFFQTGAQYLFLNKIGSASFATRMKTVLPDLTIKDQTGFVKGRYW